MPTWRPLSCDQARVKPDSMSRSAISTGTTVLPPLNGLMRATPSPSRAGAASAVTLARPATGQAALVKRTNDAGSFTSHPYSASASTATRLFSHSDVRTPLMVTVASVETL